jgi:membrane-associated phospholipid phosphatase
MNGDMDDTRRGGGKADEVGDAVDQSSPAAEVATGRDWQRSVTFFVVLAVLVVPFLLLLLLVTDKWGPLAAADQGARDGLHAFALGQPWFVAVMRTFSDSGSSLAWQIVTVVLALVLLVRRRWRLAAFVVVTIAGSSLLNTAVKATVNRDRPAVDQPFVNEPGASFPSGHSQAAMVGYGVLLLLLLPALSRAWRRVAVLVAVAMVLGIGFSRVALAAHFVSDVLAGFALGAVWLGLLTAIFRPWRHIEKVATAVAPTRGD